MKRLFPAPLLSAALFAMWLLLKQSTSAADLVIALAVAVVMPLLSAPLRPQRPQVLRPLVLTRLVFLVGCDVVVSCLRVAHGVLLAWVRAPRSHFVSIPLELRDPHGLAALAVITTVVPGTVWCELSADGATLLLHVFEMEDEQEFVAHYKQRYERPLLEIFQ